MRRANPEISFAMAYLAFRRDYERAYAWLTESFGNLREAAKYPDAIASSTAAAQAIVGAKTLVSIVLHDKQVPESKATAFARAVKTFERVKRTKNAGALFIKHIAALQLLLETNAWPDKGTHEDRTFRVGPFHVHNQTQIGDVTATIKVLESAASAIEKSRVPKATQILYGDVYLSGEISRRKTEAARYYIEKDTVFLHLIERFSEHAERSLIHEFGHRYWNRVLDAKTKSAWYTHHQNLGRVDVAVPKPGDTIVVGVHPDKPDKLARVVEIRDGGRGRWFVHVEGGGHFNLDSYLDLARKIERIKRYPTSYASTDHEEHFCEAFSLYCLGDLKEPHRANFEAIVGVPPLAPPRAEIPLGAQGSLFTNPSRARRLAARIGGT